MITGTPSDLDISGPTNRGIVSLVLPAGNGTTIVINFSGKPAAFAPGPMRDADENSAASINVFHFINGSFLLILNVLDEKLGVMLFGSPGGARRRAASSPAQANPALRFDARAVVLFPDLSPRRQCRRGNVHDRPHLLLPDFSCCEWYRPESPAS